MTGNVQSSECSECIGHLVRIFPEYFFQRADELTEQWPCHFADVFAPFTPSREDVDVLVQPDLKMDGEWETVTYVASKFLGKILAFRFSMRLRISAIV